MELFCIDMYIEFLASYFYQFLQRYIKIYGVVDNGSVGEKLSWFIRHLSDGLYIFYINLWNLPSEIWA